MTAKPKRMGGKIAAIGAGLLVIGGAYWMQIQAKSEAQEAQEVSPCRPCSCRREKAAYRQAACGRGASAHSCRSRPSAPWAHQCRFAQVQASSVQLLRVLHGCKGA